jgi:hypothetical protein
MFYVCRSNRCLSNTVANAADSEINEFTGVQVHGLLQCPGKRSVVGVRLREKGGCDFSTRRKVWGDSDLLGALNVWMRERSLNV